jgi:hypothetical protein
MHHIEQKKDPIFQKQLQRTQKQMKLLVSDMALIFIHIFMPWPVNDVTK